METLTKDKRLHFSLCYLTGHWKHNRFRSVNLNENALYILVFHSRISVKTHCLRFLLKYLVVSVQITSQSMYKDCSKVREMTFLLYFQIIVVLIGLAVLKLVGSLATFILHEKLCLLQ